MRDAWCTAARTARAPGSPTTAGSGSATGGSPSSTSPTPRSQPMGNEDGSLQIVFNGEIYNHAEIRPELERSGSHRWRTDHSDTEVILHAFEEWGIDCLHRFRGMFAIALWDERSRELWLVRDRIGIKPLYYSRPPRARRLRLRDQGAAARSGPGSARSTRRRSSTTCRSSPSPAPKTLFEGIRKLPPGTWMRVPRERRRPGGALLGRLGPRDAPPGRVARRRSRARLLDELRTSVRLRKVSDVPVGVFLSGGIDSSTNAALFSEGEHAPGQDLHHRLRGRVRELQERAPLRPPDGAGGGRGAPRAPAHASTTSSTSCPEMVRLQDEPIADPVCVPVYYVSKLARDNGVIVCQVGEGADELFWGYPSGRPLLERAAVRRPPRSPGPQAGGACCAEGAGEGPGHPVRVAAAREPRTAGLLGRRRGVHRRAEAPAALAAPAAKVRRAHLVGGARARSGSASRRRRGSRPTSTG